ncbi:MAG TPA: carboxymuconolactone decarboxylase family protein [Methylomirabilota bacterium]|nr:carboxymuconolactone decarboxylase family protein [Methylomirabilota bacterium]
MTNAYEALGAAAAGPLDGRTRELVKLALAIGARLEGAVHAHVRRALEAGVPAAPAPQAAGRAIRWRWPGCGPAGAASVGTDPPRRMRLVGRGRPGELPSTPGRGRRRSGAAGPPATAAGSPRRSS